jgi:UDP-2,3-diacylglucosamine hydrolase
MSVIFISDLHLSAERPEKLALFHRFLDHSRGRADAIYILGDLFEIWLGDDDDSEPHPEIVAALAELTFAGVALYVMRGNRDFLFGDDFARETGATMLPDYHVLDLFGTATLLTHGDLLCTKDVQYQAFRKYVQDPRHQADFLSRDLPERRQLAAEMRSGTQASMLEKDDFIMDVDDDTVVETMRGFSVQRLIHGHTHRPAVHTFEIDGVRCSRVVLGDWYEQDSLVVCKPSGITQYRVGEFLAG